MSETMPNDRASAIEYDDDERPNPLARVLLVVLVIVIVLSIATFWYLSRLGSVPKAQARGFIDDLVANNLTSAKARCAPTVDLPAIDRLYDDQVRHWGKMTHISLIVGEQGDRADVDGSLEFENLKKTFSATLMKQPDGTYLITTYGFN